MNVTLSRVTFKHLLLPCWLGAYKYKQKLYQIALNARTGEVSGARPYSVAKIAALVLFILFVIAVLAILGRN
jgi:hypothetical protein